MRDPFPLLVKISHRILLCAVVSAGVVSCNTDPPIPESTRGDEYYAGGATTVFDASSHAFSMPAPNLSSSRLDLHLEGDAAFEKEFVTAPSAVNSGLGPVFNQTSCIKCHPSDGRTALPTVFRISIPGMDAQGGPLAVPGFGSQLQNFSTQQTLAEGEVMITYETLIESFADGEKMELRKPVYTLANTYQSLPAGVMLSVRSARPVFGLGLLEAIAVETLEDLADPLDMDADGISGRVNYVWNEESQSTAVGRFGWKANQSNLRQQTAAAYHQDMGITSYLYPEESCYGQPQYDGLNDDAELETTELEATVFYCMSLGVPAPRQLSDPEVQLGKTVFLNAGCQHCHSRQLVTGDLPGFPEGSNQVIYPYTDLLLHDMGEGLADHRPDFLAGGTEWRTPPLWGIGLSFTVNGNVTFLHDGRARSLMEAILWHGGEAENAKNRVKNLSREEREALIRFLSAL